MPRGPRYGARMPQSEPMAVSVPTLRAFRWRCDAPYTGIKESYAIGRVEHGSAEWRAGRRRWRTLPGALQLAQPGDVHRGTPQPAIAVHVVALPASLVEDRLRVERYLAARDPRGAALHRLLDATRAGAPRLALETALTEAIAALAAVGDAPCDHDRAVARAIELMRARLASPLTLDELAAHAGVDKFRLCRAFRSQIGFAPYAYLTRLRIARAKQLLAAGAAPAAVAPAVGLYDQSQLTRHFRRLVGTTPGRFARASL